MNYLSTTDHGLGDLLSISLVLSFALLLRSRFDVGEVRFEEFDVATVCKDGVRVVGDLSLRVVVHGEISLVQPITEAWSILKIGLFRHRLADFFMVKKMTKTNKVQVVTFEVLGHLAKCLTVSPDFLVRDTEEI